MSEQLDANPFFQLVIGDGDKIELDNAIAPVRWCTNGAMIDQCLDVIQSFHKRKVSTDDLYIALTVSHPVMSSSGRSVRFESMSRVICPLKDGMAYVTINRPGRFFIYASIVAIKDDEHLKRTIRRCLERSRSGRMERDIVSDYVMSSSVDGPTSMDFANVCWNDAEMSSSFVAVNYKIRKRNTFNFESDTCPVQFATDGYCSPELFSSITPNWFTDWVNYGYESKIIDQCSFRRRMIVWALFKSWSMPILAVLWMLFFTVVGIVALFIGYNFIDFKKVFTLQLEDEYGESQPIPARSNTVFVNTYAKYPLLLLIHPVSWPLWYMTYTAFADGYITRLLQYVAKLFFTVVSFWHIAAIGVAIIGVIAGLCFVVHETILAYLNPLSHNTIWKGLPAKIHNWLDRRRVAQAELRRQRTIDRISCGGDPLKFVSAPKPKSIKLLAKSVKAKVCKPMSL